MHLQALARRDAAIAAIASGATALIVLLGAHRLGAASLFVPLGLVLVLAVLLRPVLAVSLAVGLAVVCEGESFGLLSFSQNLYHEFYHSLTPLDGLVVLAAASVALDLMRKRRSLQIPPALVFPMMTLVLAMASGVVTGHGSGISIRSAVLAENIVSYLVIMPIAVANLDLDRRQVVLLLGGAFALAIVKAVLGLLEVFSGRGIAIEGTSTLTYYEPTANWLIMIALLGVFTAVLARLRPPLWMLLGTPLLIASLLLSYRRSFWIATVLGLLLVLLLALSPVGRRLLVPASLFIVAAIWLLGSLNFQSGSPIAKRVASLSPTSVQTNVEDRYRLDERANVLATIKRHPVTGVGILVPWEASARPLSVEHEDGRQYVHFAALWFWLKLGILGLIAYVALFIATARLSWQVWRRSREPLLRAFGLASLCGIAGLVVVETTASFTGVDLRFTVLFGAQIGLLALLARTARSA